MIVDILIIFIALLALVFASLFDIKTREVPDWLNFSLIVSILGLRLIHSLTTSAWYYFLYGLLGFAIMFVAGNVLYYSKQMGGGDAKLLMGLGAVFATTPFFLEPTLPYLLIFVINLFVVGSVYGLVWSVVLFVKNRKKSVAEFKRKVVQTKNQQGIILGLALFLILAYIITDDAFLKTIYLLTFVFMIAYMYVFTFVKVVEKVNMFKWVQPNKLTEGDWIGQEVKINNRLICGPQDPGIDQKQINLLIKYKVKKVLLKEGMPFAPAIFLTGLVTIIFGNILLFLTML
ncbi:MAG: A24 family peptidase [archaeon]